MKTMAGFRAWIAASGAAMLLVTGASSASAQTAEGAAYISCIKKVSEAGGYPGIWRSVTVENRCAWTYDIKLVWNNGRDSPCVELSPEERYRDENNSIASYQGAVHC